MGSSSYQIALIYIPLIETHKHCGSETAQYILELIFKDSLCHGTMVGILDSGSSGQHAIISRRSGIRHFALPAVFIKSKTI